MLGKRVKFGLWALVVLVLSACYRPQVQPAVQFPLSFAATPMPTVTPRDPTVPLTPTPLVPRQAPSALTVYHTVAYGETLTGIAQTYGTTVEALLALNGIANADQLAVGQRLQITQAVSDVGPEYRLIPDSELVYGPAYADFDIEAVTAAYPGWFNEYSEELDGRLHSASEIVEKVALQYSVGPRVLLTLLELRSGWLTNPDPSPQARLYPLGYEREYWEGLYLQLGWVASALNAGFYGWHTESLWTLQLANGEYVQLAPTLNAGTVGVQCALTAGLDAETWHALLNPATPDGFSAVYRSLFGDPFYYAIEPLLPPGDAPELALPWPVGETWYLTGGPHGGWDAGSAWAAVDFVPDGDQLGCYQSRAWVTAVAPGTILYSDDGLVLQTLEDGRFLGAGWLMIYMHVAREGRVSVGAVVDTGDRIGHPSCEGGVSSGTHLHFARRYNGVWIAADNPQWPLILDGWRAASSGTPYNGTLTRDGQVRTACQCREPSNAIQHTGSP